MNTMKKGADILLLLVLLWCGLIIIAPLLAFSDGFLQSLSILLYKFFGIICHQFESHTFHIESHPFGVCIRCTAIYFGFLFGILSMRFLKRVQRHKLNAPLLLLFVSLPMVFDGAFPLTGWYDATTFTRLFTGGLFGCGLSLVLYNSLTAVISSTINSTSINYESTT